MKRIIIWGFAIIFIIIIGVYFLKPKRSIINETITTIIFKIISQMKIISVFQNNEKIPEKYTCRGKDINPPLKIENIPQKTQSLVLIIDDPDAPNGTWIHWMVANIDPNTAIIAENSVPQDAVQGKNSWGKIAYGGPCPPSDTHRYFFKIYALDQKLDLKEGFTFEELSQKMKGHVLEYQELIGLAST